MLTLVLLAAISIGDERAAAELCAKYATSSVAIPNEDPRDLAEAYANGTGGGKQDFASAIHVICKTSEIAPMEQWSMLDHVVQLQRGETAKPLDYCEHVTSGYGMTFCAVRETERATPELQARFGAVRGQYGEPLAALRKRADAFIEADAAWQAAPNRGGTIYPSEVVHARLDRERKLVESLERYAKQRGASASEDDAKRADAELNAAYRKRMAASEAGESDELRTAQRAWIGYRDAWMAAYERRWKGAAPAVALRREIATLLSRERAGEFLSTDE